MNLKGVKLVKEDKDTWHLQGPRDTAPFRVAKKGMSPEAHGKIAQHFAGTEPHFDEGGEVGGTGSAPDVALTPTGPPLDMGPSLSQFGAPVDMPGMPGQPAEVSTPQGQSYAAQPPAAPDTTPPAAPAPASPGDASPAPAATGPAQPQVPSVDQLTKGLMVGSGVAPGYQKGMQDSLAAQGRAAVDAGDARAAEATEKAEAMKKIQDESQARLGQIQQQHQANLALQQKTYSDIASSKIDPGQFWAKKGTAAKIGAALAAGLAGWGSAILHQENPALKIINQAVDQDIEAQKANLSEKNNRLHMLMEQGHTLQESEQIEKSDALNRVAATSQQIGLKYAGPQSQAAAAQQSEAFKQQGLGVLQGVYDRKQQAAAHNAQVKLQALGIQGQLSAQQRQREMTDAIFSGRSDVPPQALGMLDEKTRSRTVQMPDGSYAMAYDDKDAPEVRKALHGVYEFKDALGQYNELLKKHPNGVSSTMSPTDYAAAKSLRSKMTVELNGISGLTRFTDLENEKYGDRIADLTSKQTPWSAGYQAQLEQLGGDLDSKVRSLSRAYLMPQTGRAQQKRTQVVDSK